MSRIDREVPTSSRIYRVKTRGQQAAMLIRPLDDDTLMWPNAKDIVAAQQKYEGSARVLHLELDEHGIDVKVWIPSRAAELIRRMLIIAHCGPQGHRGRHAIEAQLNRYCCSTSFSVDAYSVEGKVIPRPWGETYRAEVRNEALHWDFLYLHESFRTSKYVLVLKDDCTHFCELVLKQFLRGTAARKVWISDNGSHFKNEVVGELCRKLRSKQQLTFAYCPWINGSIERLNRDILQVFRTMLLDYKMDAKDWVALVPLVQANLNHTALPSLGGRAPVETFTGLPCPSPLETIFLNNDPHDQQKQRQISLREECEALEQQLHGHRSSVEEMHRQMENSQMKQTLLNKKQRRGERLVNFTVGDYVLRSRFDEKVGNKLLVTWIGPFVITRADYHSFRVKNLITGAESDVHASRLKFYADKELQVTEELREHVVYHGIVLKHRWNARINDYELLMSWQGLETIEDAWEPMRAMKKDVRVKVETFVQQTGDVKFISTVMQN
ncbi:LOW QUALITY PROTEIN: hypothetical protein PHMEG_00024933 [Phytophthora megakarya]|uniref:Integrase catalytic domain-containing protein n=1 Tax=Phytophthora megakarya TaxID=4795 RepID=A0A225VDG3_9STRA|nr:LOW QUALITY PROTEIN: hypothetical protein PHMEG_00024933 [Phytophthora megakarya]